MIKISVDEAYAFDYYSIIFLKKENGVNVDKSINIIKNDIIQQIGLELFNEIINSNEYNNLYMANKKTFDAVDKAKTDSVLASYVDECNYFRMMNKKDLQNKFFSNELVETKIGYDKITFKNE
jgi:hypothetical protein